MKLMQIELQCVSDKDIHEVFDMAHKLSIQEGHTVGFNIDDIRVLVIPWRQEK